MRMMRIVCALLIVGMSAIAVTGQTPPGISPGMPGALGVVSQEQGPVPAVEQENLPVEKIDAVELNDLVNLLKEKLPGFNGVVIRQPNAAADYPIIPQMTLKNVTLGQFLEMIRTEYAGVSISRIDGKGPKDTPLYVFNVSPVPGMEKPTDAPTSVQIYSLNQIVLSLERASNDPKSDPKKAMNDVLSLVQAALEEAGGHDKPVLKVHEATQTLVFRGSPDQRIILEQALDSLRPKETEQVAKATAETLHWKQLANELENQRNDMEMHARQSETERMELRKRVMDYELELKQTQKELAAAKQPTTRP